VETHLGTGTMCHDIVLGQEMLKVFLDQAIVSVLLVESLIASLIESLAQQLNLDDMYA
jgi:hypothetical protein